MTTCSDRLIDLMCQGGIRDVGIPPSLKKQAGCYPQTSRPAYFVEFEGAGHFALTDLNPRYHEIIDRYSLAFFDKHLRSRASAKPGERVPGVSELKTR